jgi:mRNA-degrading endonuclease RelE of RelBE toxin-antitoxin system
MWTVSVSKRALNKAKKLPDKTKAALALLLKEIEAKGPVRGNWPNYSKLSDGRHHCHLSHSYVAVWQVMDKEIKLVEVIYVGTREKAPY